jgi:hypothetical protein
VAADWLWSYLTYQRGARLITGEDMWGTPLPTASKRLPIGIFRGAAAPSCSDLGVFVRLGAVIGALQIVNLWLGLYSAPNEWPWTYFFLILLMLSFALHHYGRSLGVDAIIVNRIKQPRTLLGRTLVAEAT